MKNQNHPRASRPNLFESLEKRELLSGSTFSTSTSLEISKRSALIGQTITIKGVVASSGGIDKGATVELLNNGADTGLSGKLNHLGYYVFTLDPGHATYVGTNLWRIRVLTNGDFVGSKSRQLTEKTTAPALTTESDGLEVATVTTGTGTADAADENVTVKYTGFNASTGAIFDASDNDSVAGTFQFVLDATPNEAVISGFDQEVTGMKIGETRVAILPPSLAYPSTDTSSSLAGDTLVFVVELVAD